MRVLLVTMPFGALDRPSLALGLLRAGLNAAGIGCDTAYFNLTFARDLGVEAYRLVSDQLPMLAMAPDWTFAESLFGAKAKPGYVDEVLRATWRTAAERIDAVRSARSLAPRFLTWAESELPWAHYDLVGFTCSYGQTIPSLALARRLKQRHNAVSIAFGGPAWHGPMGRALFTSFPFVDAACIDEGDRAFPSFMAALAADRDCRDISVPGMLTRAASALDAEREAELVTDLDSLPIADFGDYERAAADAGVRGEGGLVVPVETSRGCWWATRGPCVFCGISGAHRAYRAKSTSRILRELRSYARQPNCRLLEIVDNVASPQLLSGVLPQLAERPLGVPLFLEVRPEVGRPTLELMSQIGASTQVGIESFCDRVLDLMNKGTSALENVRFLKWCKALGVTAHWNLLYGVPGERPEDYEDMITLLDAIRYLTPPDACGSVKLERFSPYFDDPARYGFSNVRPAAAYGYLFPFGDDTLAQIAYFFDYDYSLDLEPPLESFRLLAYANAWRRESGAGELRLADGGQNLVDSRVPGQVETVALTGLEQALYAACDDVQSRSMLHELARQVGEDGEGASRRVDIVLASFVERGLMLAREERFLSLALPEHPRPGAA